MMEKTDALEEVSSFIDRLYESLGSCDTCDWGSPSKNRSPEGQKMISCQMIGKDFIYNWWCKGSIIKKEGGV